MKLSFFSSLLAAAASFFAAGTLGAVETKTIMFVGDSISVGVGASHPGKRYSTLAVDMLNKAAGKTLYKEVNVAISGSTMTDQPWPSKHASGYPYRLKNVLKVKPDILVIQHGVNDNGVGCSLPEFSMAYRRFVQEVKAKLPQTAIVCMTACPSKYEDPGYDIWLNSANVAIQEIAACEETMLAQVNLALRNRLELFPDCYHPNDEGCRIIAETLVATIRENRRLSRNNFDFVAQRPGTYRLCGYIFQIPEATAANNSYTCFYNVGKKGWSYSSNGPVKVTSPYKYYFSPMKCELENGAKAQFTYRKYFKNGIWQLPGTGNKLIKATLTAEKGK
ncbi:MAG: SGNH/GDSL hydrolase family protein [Lentisphaerae bacterium]|nr:SGNH/GDSL hydrolase family protein [Lentisphaerota bacterium]